MADFTDEWVPIVSGAKDRFNNTYATGAGCSNYNTLSAAIGLTDAPTTGVVLHADARHAVLSVEVQAVRRTVNGQTPTAALGLLMPVGIYFFENERDALTRVKFIEVVAGAKISVEYYK